MDFLGMGTGEILLILFVALLIWGPERIVDISKTLGKMVHSLRKGTADLTAQISREVEEKEDKNPLPQLKVPHPLNGQNIDTNDQ